MQSDLPLFKVFAVGIVSNLCFFHSGEAGFKHLSWNLGWALRPMISRIHQISKEIPITFIYGSRSWMDRKTAWDIKNIRHGCYVDVQVKQN